MEVDWGQAGTIAIVGFVTVFLVLTILAFVLRGSSLIINRFAARKAANPAVGKEK